VVGEAAGVLTGAGWVLERLVQPTRASAAKANRARMIRTGRMATCLSSVPSPGVFGV
jgi:hypothetical protein